MAKVKMKKKSTRIDMTAMCDVSFLLLTFFVMTSTAKLPEPFPVITPHSTVQTKIPESNLATITVGEDNEGKKRVFFGVTGKDVRKLMLSEMGELYKVDFTPEQTDAFSLIDFFGVDIKVLDKLIEMKGSDRNKEGVQPGIPYDSLNNQLRDWIWTARKAQIKFVSDTCLPKEMGELHIAIKGDKDTDYPVVKKVIDILQEQGKNNFFLVTGLRGDDF